MCLTMTDLNQFDQLEPASAVVTYSGAGTAAVAWGLSLNQWVAVAAGIAAVFGAAFQIYFGIRRERRSRELHQIQIKKLKED